MIEKIFNKIWYTKKGENYFLFYRLVSLSLLPITFIYYIIISLRKYAYNSNLFKTHYFETPIIIVGNHIVGGSGKTPFCIWLANHLIDKGLRVGIVSSGYRALSKKPQLVNDKSDPNVVGDEAVMIAKLTKADIVSCGNRVEATKLLINRCDNSIIIHDDGLQHLALGRELEIVLSKNKLDSNNLGIRDLLPSGPYRDFEYKEREGNFSDEDTTQSTKTSPVLSPVSYNNRIYDYGNISTINKTLKSLSTNTTKNIEDFKNKTIHLVSGIASVINICENLKKNKINVIVHKYHDHYKFNGSEFNFNDSLPIFVTMKDYVKLYNFKNKNIWVIDQTLIIKKDFIEIIDKKIDLIR